MGERFAFVDEFTAWITGPTSQGNHSGVEAIIEIALDWEKRSGATPEAPEEMAAKLI